MSTSSYIGIVLHVVHHPAYVAPAPPGSGFPHNKYGLVMDALRRSQCEMIVHVPEIMPRLWLDAVHDPDYVSDVLNAAVRPNVQKRIGFAVTEQVSLRHGYAANSAGGSHHALADTGAGYCVFNDLVLASNRLLAEGDASRILILDLDVHQGDGTAALTAGRPEIFTFSIHAEKNFPERKARSSLDISLPDGTGDSAYLDALTHALPNVLKESEPDLVLLQAGVDAHVDDRLGRLALTDAGLTERDRFVAALARDHGLPIASTLGGGYGQDRLGVAERHARSMITIARHRAA